MDVYIFFLVILVLLTPSFISQNGGLILVDLVGHFPEVLGWLWYLLASFLTVLTTGIIITLNILRIFLISKVKCSVSNINVISFLFFSQPVSTT